MTLLWFEIYRFGLIGSTAISDRHKRSVYCWHHANRVAKLGGFDLLWKKQLGIVKILDQPEKYLYEKAVEDLYKIHAATLEVLEKTGIFVENADSLEHFDFTPP